MIGHVQMHIHGQDPGQLAGPMTGEHCAAMQRLEMWEEVCHTQACRLLAYHIRLCKVKMYVCACDLTVQAHHPHMSVPPPPCTMYRLLVHACAS